MVLFGPEPGAAVDVHEEIVTHDGGDIPKKETTWQILPLGPGDQYVVCATSSNTQGKRCKSTFELSAFLAVADSPLEPVQAFGGFEGEVRVEGRPVAGGATCAVSPAAPEGVDYMILRTEWKSKSCRKVRAGQGFVGDKGHLSSAVEAEEQGAIEALVGRRLLTWRSE